MTTNEITSNELATTLTEMLEHLNKVATMVAKVFPDDSVGQSIKDCGEKLKQHIELLVVKASGVDVLDAYQETDINEINTLVMKECTRKLNMMTTLDLNAPSFKSNSDYLLGLLNYLKK